jgi:hypothetical protein
MASSSATSIPVALTCQSLSEYMLCFYVLAIRNMSLLINCRYQSYRLFNSDEDIRVRMIVSVYFSLPTTTKYNHASHTGESEGTL